MTQRIPRIALTVAALGGLLLARPAAAAELRGRVSEVTDQQVRVTIEGELLPQPGDEVVITFQIPGGPVVKVGTWSVTSVQADAVLATRVQATGVPAAGQAATIISANPVQRRSAAAADPQAQGSGNFWTVRFEGRNYRTLFNSGTHNGLPIDMYHYRIRTQGGEQPVQGGEELWGRFVRVPSARHGDQSSVVWWHATFVQRADTWELVSREGVQVEISRSTTPP